MQYSVKSEQKACISIFSTAESKELFTPQKTTHPKFNEQWTKNNHKNHEENQVKVNQVKGFTNKWMGQEKNSANASFVCVWTTAYLVFPNHFLVLVYLLFQMFFYTRQLKRLLESAPKETKEKKGEHF